MSKTPVTLSINGRNHAISVEPRRTLADAIREDCGQTGTHLGCEHGICGACTVIVNGEPDISDADLLDVLSSNLCRCNGYQNIIKAVRAAAAEMRGCK